MSIQIDTYRASGGMGAWTPGACTSAYRVSVHQQPGSVNFRCHRLWRPDNRYAGTMTVRRHESGGVEFSFDALRHGAKPRKPVVVDAADVDKLILSLLEVRVRDGGVPATMQAESTEGREN